MDTQQLKADLDKIAQAARSNPEQVQQLINEAKQKVDQLQGGDAQHQQGGQQQRQR